MSGELPVRKARRDRGGGKQEAGASAAEPETPSSGTGTLYKVQTGAFKQKSNAQTLEKKLKAAGFDTYVVNTGGYYKVQVGAFSKKANAEAMLAKLKAAGYSDAIYHDRKRRDGGGFP